MFFIMQDNLINDKVSKSARMTVVLFNTVWQLRCNRDQASPVRNL